MGFLEGFRKYANSPSGMTLMLLAMLKTGQPNIEYPKDYDLEYKPDLSGRIELDAYGLGEKIEYIGEHLVNKESSKLIIRNSKVMKKSFNERKDIPIQNIGYRIESYEMVFDPLEINGKHSLGRPSRFQISVAPTEGDSTKKILYFDLDMDDVYDLLIIDPNGSSFAYRREDLTRADPEDSGVFQSLFFNALNEIVKDIELEKFIRSKGLLPPEDFYLLPGEIENP